MTCSIVCVFTRQFRASFKILALSIDRMAAWVAVCAADQADALPRSLDESPGSCQRYAGRRLPPENLALIVFESLGPFPKIGCVLREYWDARDKMSWRVPHTDPPSRRRESQRGAFMASSRFNRDGCARPVAQLLKRSCRHFWWAPKSVLGRQLNVVIGWAAERLLDARR
jgi:hypothetical protein